ncbi:MAG: SufS family cysteine desulfurase [Actinomycetia bacterium]|nr:SufS family cysteine desulfurase [Actinomycetes bacterium]
MTDSAPTLDVAAIKADFPILARRVNDTRLVYLDSAATSQKPRCVIDAMERYYSETNANVHRGAHTLAAEASEAMESARRRVARFIKAPEAEEVIFTKNATEALNLVARSWGGTNLGPGDAVVLSHLEHHSNIVPWQILAAEKGFEIRWIAVGDDGHLDLTTLPTLLDGAKVLAVTAMSNVTGALTSVNQMVTAAHEAGAIAVIDACQAVPHLATDVAASGADFVAFSGHKMLGPTGVGVLWGRREILDAMPPFLGGGSMIENVTTEGFTTAALPAKFEAGTPPIAEIVGLGAAVEYLDRLGMDNVRRHEIELTAYALRALKSRFGDEITVHGPSEPSERGGVFSFALGEVHPHDISQVLDQHGVAVRAGHHCAKPLMKVLGIGATARASVYVYNDEADIDQLVDGLAEAADFFAF